MIRIGETHVIYCDEPQSPGHFSEDEGATEAVKRLVEAMSEIETAAEFFVQDGVSSNALRGGHYQILDKARAALAPFTDTDVTLVDSGLRSCATTKDDLVSVIERLLASVEADTDEVARAEEAARTLLQQIKGDQHG